MKHMTDSEKKHAKEEHASDSGIHFALHRDGEHVGDLHGRLVPPYERPILKLKNDPKQDNSPAQFVVEHYISTPGRDYLGEVENILKDVRAGKINDSVATQLYIALRKDFEAYEDKVHDAIGKVELVCEEIREEFFREKDKEARNKKDSVDDVLV
jgi:hypothetical protein